MESRLYVHSYKYLSKYGYVARYIWLGTYESRSNVVHTYGETASTRSARTNTTGKNSCSRQAKNYVSLSQLSHGYFVEYSSQFSSIHQHVHLYIPCLYSVFIFRVYIPCRYGYDTLHMFSRSFSSQGFTYVCMYVCMYVPPYLFLEMSNFAYRSWTWGRC